MHQHLWILSISMIPQLFARTDQSFLPFDLVHRERGYERRGNVSSGEAEAKNEAMRGGEM